VRSTRNGGGAGVRGAVGVGHGVGEEPDHGLVLVLRQELCLEVQTERWDEEASVGGGFEFPGGARQALVPGRGQVADAESAGVRGEFGEFRCLVLARPDGEQNQVGCP
jgi:hypothetical protein